VVRISGQAGEEWRVRRPYYDEHGHSGRGSFLPQQRLTGLPGQLVSPSKPFPSLDSRAREEGDAVGPCTFVTETDEVVIGGREAPTAACDTAPVVVMTPPKSPEDADAVAKELGSDHLGVFRGLSRSEVTFPAEFMVKHEVAGLRSAYAETHSRLPPHSPTGEPAFTTFHCRMKASGGGSFGQQTARIGCGLWLVCRPAWTTFGTTQGLRALGTWKC
jgi:hypothetical protein